MVTKVLSGTINASTACTRQSTSTSVFRVLNVIDDCDRVAVAQKVALSMPAKRVIRFMEEIIWDKGKPDNVRRDNGSEFISHEFQEWCKGNGMISPRIMFQMSTPKMRSKKEESSRIKESSASCCEKRTGVLTAAPRLFIFDSEQMCRFSFQREYV